MDEGCHQGMDEGCEQVLEHLQVLLDGECGPELEQQLRAHLADCPPCIGRADFERELRRMVATKCRDTAPAGLVDRIVDDLRARSGEADASDERRG